MLCIIMDYADSGDLAERIKEQRRAERYFPERRVALWFTQLVSAVDFLHYSKMIHRDIKPANIFLHRRDVIKLGDLGLSKYDHAVTSDKKHTVCGSPLYLAPEVHMGRDYSKKVDVWAIGCVLFEIMMLEHAFQVRHMAGPRACPDALIVC